MKPLSMCVFFELLSMIVLLPFGIFFYLEFKRRNDLSIRYGRWGIYQAWGKPWIPFISFI